MNTERTLELLGKFKTYGISHDEKRKVSEHVTGLQDVLDFQDCIGRATPPQIHEFYTGLAYGVRQEFMWVVFNTLAMDTALDILDVTAGRALKIKYRDQAEAYIERELESIYQRENILRESKKHIFRHIARLTNYAGRLNRKLENAQKLTASIAARNERLQARNVELEKTYGEKAHRFDTLRGNLQAVLGWSEQE